MGDFVREERNGPGSLDDPFFPTRGASHQSWTRLGWVEDTTFGTYLRIGVGLEEGIEGFCNPSTRKTGPSRSEDPSRDTYSSFRHNELPR